MKISIWIGLVVLVGVMSCKSSAKTTKEKTESIVQEKASANIIINDIWALQSMDGIDYSPKSVAKGIKIPTLEFHLNEMRYAGNDGCNSIFGTIEQITDVELHFGAGGGTRKFCEDDNVSPVFRKNMELVAGYKIEKTSLFLLGQNGKVLMIFRKVD